MRAIDVIAIYCAAQWTSINDCECTEATNAIFSFVLLRFFQFINSIEYRCIRRSYTIPDTKKPQKTGPNSIRLVWTPNIADHRTTITTTRKMSFIRNKIPIRNRYYQYPEPKNIQPATYRKATNHVTKKATASIQFRVQFMYVNRDNLNMEQHMFTWAMNPPFGYTLLFFLLTLSTLLDAIVQSNTTE